ncbi:MAG: N-acetyltransferase [Pirellulales bacterium]|nr:N-acetyltransferase [Pirellulales bacterium]
MSLTIRIATTADAEDVLAIYGPYCESSAATFEIVAPSVDQIRERIERVSLDYPWLVGEAEGHVVGYVYATRFRERAAYRWTAEVAAYVAANSHRRGVGARLYRTLFEILRAQNYFKAIAGITLPNPASVGLHERVGFVQTGMFPAVGCKGSAWLDVGWWQLELQPLVTDPPEPIPFQHLRDSQLVREALAAERASSR